MSVMVRIPTPLRRMTNGKDKVEVESANLSELVEKLNGEFPGFKDRLVDEEGELRYFVNIRQSTSGGDNTLLRGRTRGTGPDPFANVHGAGFRGVYDFADPDSSVFITSTGQSGHFLSHHYDDLAQLWRRGEYIPMSLDEELARAAPVGITKLVPEAE